MFDRRMAVLLIAVVSALFVLSLANSASAGPFAFTGKIVAIDQSGKTLTLEQDQCGQSGQYFISWSSDATVMRGADLASFDDLKVGDEVTISYYETSGGNYVADDIGILPLGMREQC